MPLNQGSALQAVNGGRNGLTITPVSPADDAGTAISMFVWMYSLSRSAADGIIGRGRRVLNEGGINLGMHWSQGGTGRIWIEYAVTGVDMGGSTYVDFLTEIVVLNQWQLIGCVVDLSLSGNARFKVFSASPGGTPTEFAPTTVFGTPPANFSTMNNRDFEVGTRLGFYNGGNNASSRWFREAAVFNRALTVGEITTLADVNPPATPTLHVPFEPTGASGIVEQVSGRTTALVGSAALADPVGTDWPFESGSTDPNGPLSPYPWAGNTYSIDFGPSTRVEVPHSPTHTQSLNAFTAIAWIKVPATFVANETFLAKWTYQTDGMFAFAHGLLANQLIVFIATVSTDTGGGCNVRADAVLTPDEWQQVAFTFAPNAVELYVNGQAVASYVAQGAVPSQMIAGTAPLRIGMFGGSLTRYYQGLIDEVSIWQRTMTPGEIAQTLDANRQPVDLGSLSFKDDMLGWYRLGDVTNFGGLDDFGGAGSNEIIDASGRGLHGTYNGTIADRSTDVPPAVAPPGAGVSWIADPGQAPRPALIADADRSGARAHIALPDQSTRGIALRAPADRSVNRAHIAVKLDAPFRPPTTGPTPPPTFPPTGACVRAVDRLIEQLKPRTKLLKVLCSIVDRAQPIFNALADTKDFRDLATATGAQLDALAVFYGTARAGRTDDELRAYLNGLVIVVATKGTAEDLIAALVRLDDGFALAAISLTNLYPAAVILTCFVPDGNREVGEAHAQVLRRVAPAGVNFQLHFEQQGATPFVWDGDTGAGFAVESDPVGTGGVWAEAL